MIFAPLAVFFFRLTRLFDALAVRSAAIAVAAQLRAERPRPGPPVILASADAKRAAEAGADVHAQLAATTWPAAPVPLTWVEHGPAQRLHADQVVRHRGQS